jgi:hypothetical protein
LRGAVRAGQGVARSMKRIASERHPISVRSSHTHHIAPHSANGLPSFRYNHARTVRARPLPQLPIAVGTRFVSFTLHFCRSQPPFNSLAFSFASILLAFITNDVRTRGRRPRGGPTRNATGQAERAEAHEHRRSLCGPATATSYTNDANHVRLSHIEHRPAPHVTIEIPCIIAPYCIAQHDRPSSCVRYAELQQIMHPTAIQAWSRLFRGDVAQPALSTLLSGIYLALYMHRLALLRSISSFIGAPTAGTAPPMLSQQALDAWLLTV